MVEPIIFIGLGFLIASLLALIALPLVHARAVRLTRRRLEAAAPASIAEIHAGKDQLRAEFALSTRKLETSVEQLKAKTTGQLADLGRKTTAIAELKTEVADKAAAVRVLETQEKSLRERLQAAEAAMAAKVAALTTATETLAARDAEVSRLAIDLADRTVMVDSHRIENVAFTTQIATLKDQIAEAQAKVAASAATLERERAQAILLASERDRLREEHAAAMRASEAQITKLREERATLQQELSALRRETESSWESERSENALLRERINDVAAEVARLTAALEGPDSPIDAMLAETNEPANGAPSHGGAIPFPRPLGGKLADRIRALQRRSV